MRDMTRTAASPPDASAPFHAGELAVQSRVGVQEQIDQIGRRIIRDHMPDQHRQFFATLPTLFVGSLDARRRPWASMLVGRPGFISSPDDRTLHVAAAPGFGDPLREHLVAGAALGLLGIEPATRRRNRLNGAVTTVDDGGFSVRVDQSFGNCPKYIQARAPHWVAEPADFARARPLRREGAVLEAAARALIARADTFFLASAAARTGTDQRADGVDVSHRGGKPGFVRVRADAGRTLLTVPDFVGNFMFNTLGNLAVHPYAGLLFADPDSGDLLQLTGHAAIVWDGPELELFTGAQRLLQVSVDEGLWIPAALPLRWSPPEFAAQLADTGAWPD